VEFIIELKVKEKFLFYRIHYIGIYMLVFPIATVHLITSRRHFFYCKHFMSKMTRKN
jgi:hypothetical protein